MSKKGGMSLCPFGSEQCLTKLDLQGSSIVGDKELGVISNIPPIRTMLVESFKDVLNNYLFYGLGNNGTCIEEFWSSVEFLFNVRSYLPETWKNSRVLSDNYFNTDKVKIQRRIVLTDKELRLMCADQMWELLEFPLSFSSFIIKIKAQREKIIVNNWEQVIKYLKYLYNKTREEGIVVTDPFTVFSDLEIRNLLVYPQEPSKLIMLVPYSFKEKENYQTIKTFEENAFCLKPIIGSLFANLNEDEKC
jgi:hypothetical protein